VEIQNVAREPGYRSKIAVVSHADGVDPVGACVGPRGSRVRMVVSELRGEKIDIIPYNDEPARFVAKALSPARVREVLVDDDARQATVIVPDDQLSLAIGREGQNARLAARLTGWRIDIKSETDFAQDVGDGSGDDGEQRAQDDGRCHAILGTGRRCPNASLPQTYFCGLDAHQALRRFDTTDASVIADLSPPELAELANGATDEERVHELVTRAIANLAAAKAAAPEGRGVVVADPLEPQSDAGEPDALAADLAEPAEEGPCGGAGVVARGHVPTRRCIACGAVRPQAELLRFVIVPGDGDRATVAADPSRTAPGRGAWTCDAACTERALARRAFPRAFKRVVHTPPDLLESMNSG
jgi:N utilization substance protein A